MSSWMTNPASTNETRIMAASISSSKRREPIRSATSATQKPTTDMGIIRRSNRTDSTRAEPVRSKANTAMARTSSQRTTAIMAPVSQSAKKVRSPNSASGCGLGVIAVSVEGVSGGVNVDH